MLVLELVKHSKITRIIWPQIKAKNRLQGLTIVMALVIFDWKEYEAERLNEIYIFLNITIYRYYYLIYCGLRLLIEHVTLKAISF